MIEKYFSGKKLKAEYDSEIRDGIEGLKKVLDYDFQKLNFNTALEKIFAQIQKVNAYINKTEPWKLAKEEKYSELEKVIFTLAESVRFFTHLLYSIMPETSEKIAKQLGFTLVTITKLNWGEVDISKFIKGPILFPKFEKLKKLKKKKIL